MIKKFFLALLTLLIIVAIARPIIAIETNFSNANFIVNSKSATEVIALSQRIVSALQKKDKNVLAAFYSPYIDETNINQLFEAFNESFPAISPLSVKLVGLSIVKSLNKPETIQTNATLQYQFMGGQWYLIALSYQTQNNVTQLLGFHEQHLADSLENINKVNLAQASLTQWSVLLLSILIPLVILIAFVLCIKTQNLSKKWLWVLFILFGVVKFQFNWTTQEFMVNLFNIQLFGNNVMRSSSFAPLILAFSIPVGAIVFLLKTMIKKCAHN